MALGLAVLAAGPVGAWATDEPALKADLGAVADRCTPANAAADGSGACLAISDDQRFVLLKDLKGDSQFLLVARDPLLRLGHYSGPEPAMWSAAWSARSCVREILKGVDRKDVPLTAIGLTINSRYGASQDRQHIHIDVVIDRPVASRGLDVAGTHYDVIKQPRIDDAQIFAALRGTPDPARATLAVLPDASAGVDLLLSAGQGGSAEGDFMAAHDRLAPDQFKLRNHCLSFGH